MLCSQPFLHIHQRLLRGEGEGGLFGNGSSRLAHPVVVQVLLEVEQERDLLLHLRWVVRQCVSRNDISIATVSNRTIAGCSSGVSTATRAPVDVLQIAGIGVEDDLGHVIEVHAAGSVGKHVSEAVLGGVVNPKIHPQGRCFKRLACRRGRRGCGSGGVAGVIDRHGKWE